MATPLETFRAWERDAPKTVCHIMVIDRGNGSAANRLTLTDKPYYDKGVSGTKYHDTYPAPIHCILSDLNTDERLDGTSFDDIILANGDGRLDTILSGEIITTKSFKVYRGDTRWSFLEDDYPERFTEIYRGKIESVTFERGGKVRLSVEAVKYAMDNTIASPTEPYGIGICYNVPAVVVDAATLKYRCNSVVNNNSYFELYDNGVQLTLTSDYNLLLEDETLTEDVSGLFRGKFELLAAPSGVITANMNWINDTSAGLGIWLLARAVRDLFFPSYITENHQYSLASVVRSRCMWIKPDGTKVYYAGITASTTTRAMHQFSLGTPWDLTTISYDTKVASFAAELGTTNVARAIQISDDGTSLYMLGSNGLFYQYTLSTPWDASTSSLDGSIDLDTLGLDGEECEAMYIHDNTVFIVETLDVYKLTMTGGDITTLVSPVFQVTLAGELGAGVSVPAIDFSSDGKRMYYVDRTNMLLVRQVNLITAWDMTEVYYPGRSFMYEYYVVSMHTIELSSFRMVDAQDTFFTCYTYGSVYVTTQFSGIADGDLPEDLIRVGISETKIGVFYNSETQIGTLFADICRSIGKSFYVARDGAIVLTSEESPTLAVAGGATYRDINLADFVGARGDHIVHTDTLAPLQKVTITYNRNFSPISESESAGSLTVAEKAALATSHELQVVTNTLTNYEDPGELQLEGFGHTSSDATDAIYPIDQFRSQPRLYFDFEVALGWTSILDEFDIGSIIRIQGEVFHPALASGDYVMVAGRKINWSKHTQTLTVFK